MKVTFLLDSLAPGGAETSTVLIAPMLVDFGIEPRIVLLDDVASELRQRAVESAVPVTALDSGGLMSKVRQLRAMMRTDPPDILHTALFRADMVGRLAAGGTAVPVIASLVNTPYDKASIESNPNLKAWKVGCVRAVDATTGRFLVARYQAVSEGVKQSNARALRIEPGKITVCQRGRDRGSLLPVGSATRGEVRQSLGADEADPVLLNVGRLEFSKGQHDLIAAFAHLLERHPSTRLWIAGKDGSASESLRRHLASEPALADQARLLGHREDVGALIRAADVLVVSSHIEGTAGAAIEAMAVGTPVVSTRISGIEGVLFDGHNALLASPASPHELAEQIDRVLTDVQLADRLAEHGRRAFEDSFTLPAAASALAGMYYDLYHEKALPS